VARASPRRPVLHRCAEPDARRGLHWLLSEATPWQKVTWNLIDWRARLQGRFRNELGAHAGFSRAELLALLGERFAAVECITGEFLRFKYGGRLPATLLNLLLSPRLLDYAAPSHYALCRRAP
jgi:hypothetical protein